jgi:hypothetical protein
MTVNLDKEGENRAAAAAAAVARRKWREAKETQSSIWQKWHYIRDSFPEHDSRVLTAVPVGFEAVMHFFWLSLDELREYSPSNGDEMRVLFCNEEYVKYLTSHFRDRIPMFVKDGNKCLLPKTFDYPYAWINLPERPEPPDEYAALLWDTQITAVCYSRPVKSAR